MPAAEPNKLVRIIVPSVVVALAVGFVILQRGTPAQQQQQQNPQQATSAAPTDVADPPADAESTAPAQPAEAQTAAEPDAPAVERAPETPSVAAMPPEPAGVGWRGRLFETPPADQWPVLGDLIEGQGYKSSITLTPFGAGIESIVLADYYNSIKREPGDHYVLQRRAVQTDAATGQSFSIAPLGVRALRVGDQVINLYAEAGQTFWELVSNDDSSATYRATIVNAEDQPVLRWTRTYTLEENTFDIKVAQRLENLTGAAMTVRSVQYGPVDLDVAAAGYRLPSNRVRFGYIAPNDPSGQIVRADGKLAYQGSIIKRVPFSGTPDPLWPDANKYGGATDLVWVAQTSRYFACAIHPDFDPQSAAPNKRLELGALISPVLLGRIDQDTADALAIELTSEPVEIEPGSTADLSFGAYAGPLGRQALLGDARGSTPDDPSTPLYRSLGLPDMVVYNLGGMCAWCTFQWLAHILLTVLLFFHDYVVFDWGISIMLLVVVVRTILHPITKKSQISVQRFAKDMQRIAPKQKKIQEKYKDDPQRMQQEMMKLMREEGVSYAGALGCLPMFLQSPVWIALYAMLYFSFELRHEPAFYGVFQAVSNDAWRFLADLSSPDNLVYFGQTIVNIPLMGEIRSINILPLLLGFVFFVHQKYMSPPPSATMTPEMKQQQRIMKVMLVVLFPVMMYNAPSGLALYFITNSMLGILESRWIRKHVDDLEARGELRKPKRQGPGKVPANPFAPKSKRVTNEAPRFKKRD
ncbi:MAG: YidC/Oxa1 family insertase periplasmic-domain containing protein [Planctomycetota bacterium]